MPDWFESGENGSTWGTEFVKPWFCSLGFSVAGAGGAGGGGGGSR